MLEELAVQDFALIERLSLSFSPRFNVITGETGAGKSILVGALGALLGMRTGPEMVRAGCEKAVIEARFRLDGMAAVRDLILNFDGELDDDSVVVRRSLAADGRTRVWIGGVSVSVKTLRDVASRLVDFHGQHDHQLLLSSSEHCGILDAFSANDQLLTSLREHLHTLKRLREERRALLEAQRQAAAQREFVESERKELEEVDPVAGELETLLAEQRVLENVERLGTLLTGLCSLLSESDDSVISRLGQGRRWVQEAASIDEQLNEIAERDYEQLEALAQDISSRFAARLGSLDVDPARLEFVANRIAQLRRLERRYGSLEHALARKAELDRGVDEEVETAGKVSALEHEVQKEHSQMSEVALELSRRRAETARRLADEVTNSLASLGMDRARFDVNLTTVAADTLDPLESDAVVYEGTPCEVGHAGLEAVEFVIAPNPGEPAKPLVRIASGGEISRVMLAIKSVLADHDPVSAMVFDEIDAGISGRIGDAVGERMRDLAQHRQVIAITHLPQIAARAERHIVVRKEESAGRTLTSAHIAEGEERVLALVELLGGGEARATALKYARAMLTESQRSEATG